MYTLYYSPGSASMVVHQALLEIGAAHRLELVDFGQRAQRDPGYLRLNPLGTVPTLIVDGEPRVESAALVMLLAERHPDANLAPPPGSTARALWYQWMIFLSTQLGAAYRLWFYPRELGADEHSPVVRAALISRIEAVFTRLDGQLASSGPYLLGDTFSGADLLLLMYMRWSRNLPRPATEWPALRSHAQRLRMRPSWERLCDIEGLTEWRGP
jgi:glutathione S-transferase